ncbi:MAG: UDP-N-acetylmuramoyl-tripeptide--D-alanyl-D-alanine ligase [Anaerolineae bacterium]|nr:UDP-N-acetylmuramoyl-tripeptide--D-alanyl-D-alanine ligase [Thermoflexales bacterium]MDW8406697.1 UDP-N-acetylmuramoyl-tripeptide--D-alanyl-D-alanine ligase [Anaerolineae bacterium]
MLTLADVIEGTGGPRIPAWENRTLREVVIDSRQALRGDLFIALRGERADGHDFVTDAFNRGASAALVDRPVELLSGHTFIDVQHTEIKSDWAPVGDNTPVLIRVDNTLKALQRLSGWWRRKIGALAPRLRVIGVTGSVGKTTTKEVIAQVLNIRYRTLKSEGNYNNEIGVPLTLLKLNAEHERAVIEMGMYQRGEIAAYCEWAQPHVGVVTMVAPVHLERLGTIENIQLAKAELVQALPSAAEGGVAVLNDDDERVRAMAGMTRARVVTYGLSPRADVWAEQIESRGLDGITLTVHHGSQSRRARAPLLGRHSAHTVLRAAAVGLVEEMNWDEIIEGLRQSSAQLRLTVLEGPHRSLVIDDTYNASEESAIAALNLLAEIGNGAAAGAGSGMVRIAVLGDMLELGDVEEQAHRNVGCRAATIARYVVCVGRRARWIAEEAVQCGADANCVYTCDTNAEALRVLATLLRDRSVILVKGSRGMKMEEIVAGLTAGNAT